MPADRDHPGSAHRLLIQLAIWTVPRICQAQVAIALRMYPIVGLVVGCMRILEVCRIPSGRAGFRQ
jgi:hypothetical protein